MAAEKSEKAPAFQFYPRDWDTDDNVTPMTYEEEGVYFALCRRYWLNGNTLPSDLDELHSRLKATEGKKRDRRMSKEKFEQIWERVGRCFKVVDGRLTHKRLDQERAKQLEHRAKRIKAAEERWAKKPAVDQTSNSNAHASNVHMHGSNRVQSSSSASSSASATAVESSRLQPIMRPRPAWAEWVGQRLHVPSKWHVDHVAKLGGPDADRRLTAWYEQEDQHLMRTQTPVRDWFKWLDARFALWVPDSAADVGTEDAAQREIAAARARRASVGVR